MYICNNCIKRNCHKSPKPMPLQEGRYVCKHFRKPIDGWKLLELCLDSSPAEIVKLCHKYGFEITETKKGFRIKPNGHKHNVKRNPKGVRSSSGRKSNAAKTTG